MSETKNPFVRVEVTPGASDDWAMLQIVDKLTTCGAYISAEGAVYAARAINQHEKLVAFCSRIASFGFSFDSRDQANGAYRDAVRWLVRDAAALLKEEKP